MPKKALYFALAFTIAGLTGIADLPSAHADLVSFLVDPDTIDANNDGFITGNEFQPTGSGGTVFSLTPTNNLVGIDRFLLSETTGLRYGGGGGSTLSFDFSVSEDILLESYTLSSSGSFLNDPTFDILLGSTAISSGNTSVSSGETHLFNGGPLELLAGQTYSFEVTNSGAAIQSYVSHWNYSVTAVPEPGGLVYLSSVAILVSLKRRKNKQAINGRTA